MIINDNSNHYDTEEMIKIAQMNKEDRNSIQRDLLNYFSRLVYLRYVNIRSLTSGNKCQKMLPTEVQEKVKPEWIRKYYPYSDQEIDFYISFAEKYLKIVS